MPCPLATTSKIERAEPAADTSRLPPAAQAEVRTALAEFDKQKGGLVGESLAVAYAQVGAVLARNGLYEPMRVAFDNAIALAPDDGRFLYLRGAFAEQAGRLDEAKTFLVQALAKDPDYLPIRYRLAETQLALNDLAGARRTTAEVVAKRPDLAPARVLLGQVARALAPLVEVTTMAAPATAATTVSSRWHADPVDPAHPAGLVLAARLQHDLRRDHRVLDGDAHAVPDHRRHQRLGVRAQHRPQHAVRVPHLRHLARHPADRALRGGVHPAGHHQLRG